MGEVCAAMGSDGWLGGVTGSEEGFSEGNESGLRGGVCWWLGSDGGFGVWMGSEGGVVRLGE